MAKSTRTKKVLMVIGVILAAVLVAAAVYSKSIVRLYRVLTLFEPDRIDDNFRNMGDLFDSRTVHRGDTVFQFKRAPKELPQTYLINGAQKSVRDFLEKTQTTGFIVVKDDTILFEQYYRGNDEKSLAITWSVIKSLISALLGIAIEEGHISDIAKPVTDYIPRLKGTGYDGVSIKDILQMSSGVRFNEDYGDFNSDINRMGRAFALNASLNEFAASLTREKKPGTFNHYVSMNTQVLGWLIKETTGKTISAYLEEKLWKPLGMESDGKFLIDSHGMEAAFGGYCMVLRDFARFGRLYLKEGNWNGKQIIPKAWVRASVTPDAPHLMPGKRANSSWVLGYGYQWWIPQNPDGDFLAIGIYGQAIYIYPKYNIVIAKTAAYRDYNKDGDDMEIESIEMFRAIARKI